MEAEGLVPKGMKDESLGDVIPFWTDDNFHDVDLVCNDGVVVGANRSILALRSEKFRKILFGTTKTETVDIPYNSQAVNTMWSSFTWIGHLLDPRQTTTTTTTSP
ncbi:expressed unknown protein [Seminavis robusta]|uniref:BTB domain-containing protein n=1 Tax=Seminavis robusta TaxID=568900 RepID=A0A9N8HVR6_9STRA|nr:expressed unknown protein [Seminavis robusta]|eukprot:Sro2398_g326170.1 n/a (105) ;mRNA; r:14161-14475